MTSPPPSATISTDYPASSHQVLDHAQEVLRRTAITANPFFTDLASGAMSEAQFRRTQEQFSFAVEFFPRPMAALIGRIPDPKARLEILHNLVEEHGEFNEQQFHTSTFEAFLRSIGADPATLEAQPLWPCLRAFNAVLTTACVLDELEVGVACMGIIELAFSSCSAAIGGAVVRHGWVPAGQLVHYKLHAAIDVRHADEFFSVVEPRWADARQRYVIQQGCELGAYIFDRLYRDLHRAAVSEGA
jgi:pyrroloquinoline-quinone synthase